MLPSVQTLSTRAKGSQEGPPLSETGLVSPFANMYMQQGAWDKKEDYSLETKRRIGKEPGHIEASNWEKESI